MANFDLFFPIIVKDEGYYANKLNDSGGETWIGISRNNYPRWAGWAIIDSYKGQANFPSILRTDANLLVLVKQFYIMQEWNALRGDDINSQSIANFMVDWATNAGNSVPVKHAQKILNLTQDGLIGPNTVAAINSADAQTFFNQLKVERIAFYKAVVANNPSDEEFLNDWISRTNSFVFTS